MEGGSVEHNLKGTHPRTIPAMFGLIWFRGFRGEDLNVKVYDVRRTPSEGIIQLILPRKGGGHVPCTL
jgi:hypothetical protein